MATICHYISGAAVALCVAACSNDDPKPAPSEDAAALGEMINLRIPVKTVRWEVFGTPERTGGFLPASTDYVTLVAELEPLQDWSIGGNAPTGMVFVVPEAARPWLSGDFRKLLEKNKNSGVDLSSQGLCRKYSTTIRKSGRTVDGFVCSSGGHVLMYLTLSSAS